MANLKLIRLISVLGLFACENKAMCQTTAVVSGANVTTTNSFLSSAVLQPPSIAQVTAFFTRNNVGDLADTDGFPLGQVCSSNSINMGAGQGPALIASVDYSGRGLCHTIIVVNVAANIVYASKIPTVHVEDVTTIENTDFLRGQTLLTLPTTVSAFAGANCQAAIPHLYMLVNGVATDVSVRYPSFYASLLSSSTYYPDYASDVSDCQQIEMAAMQQLAGAPIRIQPLADELSMSASPSARIKAVALFKLAKGTAGLSRLRAMTHDQSSRVALAASTALRELATYAK